MKTMTLFLTAIATIARKSLALAVALFILLLPTVARAARYEQLTVTELNLNGTVITNTPARLNSAAAPGGTVGAIAVQTNATVGGTLNVTGIVTLNATQTVFAAAAATTPTNMIPGAGVGINVRINGTNYLLRATPN